MFAKQVADEIATLVQARQSYDARGTELLADPAVTLHRSWSEYRRGLGFSPLQRAPSHLKLLEPRHRQGRWLVKVR
jgi:hypothetical protein